MNPLLSKFGRWAVSVASVIVGILLTIALVSVLSSAPGHDELHNRQVMLEEQLRYISCILLIPEEDRVPEAVAACQIRPEPAEDNG